MQNRRARLPEGEQGCDVVHPRLQAAGLARSARARSPRAAGRPARSAPRARPPRRARPGCSGRRSPRRRPPPSRARAPGTTRAARRRGRSARRSARRAPARRKARRRGDGRGAERVRLAARLAVGREQVADVGARDRRPRPSPSRGRRAMRAARPRDDHVPEPVVAVDDGGRGRLGQVRGEPRADLDDGGQVARAVDLPELGEPAHLPLEVAPGAHEVGDARRGRRRRGSRRACRRGRARAAGARPRVSRPGGSSLVTTWPSM